MSSAEVPNEFTPTTQAELSRFLAENAQSARRAICPVGGRTALHFGGPLDKPAVFVPTTTLNRTVDYPARDMTITVEAGLRVDELTKILEAENQQLPVDVPQSRRATLGGAVATNTSGPRRFGYGTFRDYVIGVSAVDAGGRLFGAGGRVVKNVAGYDLGKLLTGSMGTLAVITQLTLKLRPLSETAAFAWATFESLETVDRVLETLLTSQTRPVVQDVLNARAAREVAAEARRELPARGNVLCIGFEGTEREVGWQIATLKDELAPFEPEHIEVLRDEDVTPVHRALTEFQVCSEEPLTFQANLLPSQTIAFVDRATQLGVSAQAHAGNGIVIGHLPDETSHVGQAEERLASLREIARQSEGNLTVLCCQEEWRSQLPLFGAAESGLPLMRRLKSALDPHDLLNPGRFFDVTPARA